MHAGGKRRRCGYGRPKAGQCGDFLDSTIPSPARAVEGLSGKYRIQRGKFRDKGDLIDKIKSYEVQVTRTELNMALRLFKKYSLINFSDDESGEDMKIQLYPSLQFGWDLPQFQTVVREYIKEDDEDIDEPEDELIPEEFEEEEE